MEIVGRMLPTVRAVENESGEWCQFSHIDDPIYDAAPQLLEALKLIECSLPLVADADAIGEDECTEIPITWKEWSQIRAAIAKAEGRQP